MDNHPPYTPGQQLSAARLNEHEAATRAMAGLQVVGAELSHPGGVPLLTVPAEPDRFLAVVWEPQQGGSGQSGSGPSVKPHAYAFRRVFEGGYPPDHGEFHEFPAGKTLYEGDGLTPDRTAYEANKRDDVPDFVVVELRKNRSGAGFYFVWHGEAGEGSGSGEYLLDVGVSCVNDQIVVTKKFGRP